MPLARLKAIWLDYMPGTPLEVGIAVLVFSVAALVLVVVGVVARMAAPSPKPTFSDAYWREPPGKSVHPAVLGRLLAPRLGDEQFAASVLHLVQHGMLSVAHRPASDFLPEWFRRRRDPPGTYVVTFLVPRKRGKGAVDALCLSLLRTARAAATSGDQMSLRLAARWYGAEGSKDQRRRLYDVDRAWDKAVDEGVKALEKRLGLRDPRVERLSQVLSVVDLALGVACLVTFVTLALWYDTFGYCLWGIGPLILWVVALALAGNMKRLTQKGSDYRAKGLAYQAWLERFATLGEDLPTDAELWERHLAYATALGVGQKVAVQLRDGLPQVWDDELIRGRYGWMVPEAGDQPDRKGRCQTGLDAFVRELAELRAQATPPANDD